jgi:hypothetical protein
MTGVRVYLLTIQAIFFLTVMAVKSRKWMKTMIFTTKKVVTAVLVV